MNPQTLELQLTALDEKIAVAKENLKQLKKARRLAVKMLEQLKLI